MHRRIVIVLLGGMATLAVVSGARTADMLAERYAGYQWNGFYLGLGGGAGSGVGKLALGPISLPLGMEGVLGEATIGYDHMIGDRFLVGAYADAHVGNLGFSIGVPGGSIDLNAKYGFDILARAGYLVTPRTLVYALGGYGYEHFDASATGFGSLYDWSAGGYVVGLGSEIVLRDRWTLKGEYRYARYRANDLGSGGLVSLTPAIQTFHVGLNYRLGGGETETGFAVSPFDWNGLYIGGSVGAGATNNHLGLLGLARLDGLGGEGVFGEASIGYDRDFGNWVGGIQVNGRLSGMRTAIAFGPASLNVDADHGFDVLARLGMKVDPTTLAYVTGGYSWQHFDINVTGLGSIYDWSKGGYSVGGGIESAVTDHVAANIEYRYSRYGAEDFGSGGLLTVKPAFHTMRMGLKYKFN